MTESFYLVYIEDSSLYQLRERTTHFCISCGTDLSAILRVLTKYVKRYKTRERLLDLIEDLNYPGAVPATVFEQCEEYYQLHGNDFEDLLKRTIRAAITEAREEAKKNSPLAKAKSRMKRTGLVRPLIKKSKAKEKETTTQRSAIRPKVLPRRPRLTTTG